MTLHFIGDVHGKFSGLLSLLKGIPDSEKVYQVGDLGLGFSTVPELKNNFKFIRGNHDSPFIARNHPNYMGDYGYLEKENIFYMSGAFSIDYRMRTENFNWWKEEELSYLEFGNAIELYDISRPEIVITHDCPSQILECFANNSWTSNTTRALNYMWNLFRPKLWVFGHHHVSVDMHVKDTRFICLSELEIKSLR